MRAFVGVIVFVAAVVASVVCPPRPLLVWNTTASIPIGFYTISQIAPKRGDILVVRLPHEMELLAVSRAILAPGTPVLKPVVAVHRDLACRTGSLVTINGRFGAIAHDVDRQGQILPTWQGCRHLSTSEVFLLARHADSFDSRYWGPLDVHSVLGVARPLLIFGIDLPNLVAR